MRWRAHGGAIWLGDLIELLAPLGINERLLRTSVFRLVAQNWLQSERHGRRSLYLISELGQRHTAHASQRIYEGAPQDWNGEWTLVALPRIGNGLAERAELPPGTDMGRLRHDRAGAVRPSSYPGQRGA